MATTTNGIKIIYGAGGLASGHTNGVPAGYNTFHDYSKEVLEVLENERISTLDTAEIYPGSEEEIGYNGAADRFTVDTKIPGAFAAPRSKDEIIAGVKAALQKLKTTQVDILYFHAPETTVPFEEQLSAVNELYKEHSFKRLGISNFSTEQVQEFYDIAKRNGYPLPTVYQGSYSAVGRRPETDLIPTLRRLGISYYAYSPIAGGFLAKTRQQIIDKEGRFDPSNPVGKLYVGLYHKPSFLDALDTWVKIADDAGISKAELAYRWVTYHSQLSKESGDGIIFGARSPSQVKETIGYIRAGPLPADIVSRVEGVWEIVKHEAPLDNFHQ